MTFEKPKRDVKASPVEEVLSSGAGDDDFGVRSLQLMYSVNGGVGEDPQSLQAGRQGADCGQRESHRLSRGDGRQGRGFHSVLRAGDRQRHGEGSEGGEERHVLHRSAALQSGLPPGAVAGGRGRRRRGAASRISLARSPSRSGRSCPRRSTSIATRRSCRPTK